MLMVHYWVYHITYVEHGETLQKILYRFCTSLERISGCFKELEEEERRSLSIMVVNGFVSLPVQVQAQSHVDRLLMCLMLVELVKQ
jgi:hypothetical protein